jgi:hypothetical protein
MLVRHPIATQGGIQVGGILEVTGSLWKWLVGASREPGFWSGLLMGATGFAALAFIVFKVQVWWGVVTAPYRPQRVTHTTSETPAQVSNRSLKALLLGVLVFTCVLCALAGMLYPERLRRVLRVLGLAM